MIGQNLVKSWSKTQTLIATSSAESELYAAVKVTSESLGVMSLLQDLGYYPRCTVHADASAALGIIARRGLGKVRHLDVSHLWIQEIVAKKEVKYEKVAGSKNPADLFTKGTLTQQVIESHTQALSNDFVEGRAAVAAKL